MDTLQSATNKTLGRYAWGSLCGLLALFTLGAFALGIQKGVMNSVRDIGIAIVLFSLFSLALMYSLAGLPRISSLPAATLRGAARLSFVLALSPLVIPVIQFVKFFQDGTWYAINVVDSLGYVVLKMLETGWGDATLTPALFAWCVEPASMLGLHALLSWIPLSLVLLVATFVLFGGAGLLLSDDAKRAQGSAG
jgi:hypothetical protein